MTATASFPLPSLQGADFSADRTHRLLLWRVIALDRPLLGYLMLNPSTADEARSDQTTGCNLERARRLGYGGIVQANLYTYRATSPTVLKAAGYPGARDEIVLERLAELCRDIVCAWGAHARPDDARWTVNFIRSRRSAPRLWHLGLTADGMPRHPLRVPYKTILTELPLEWRPRA